MYTTRIYNRSSNRTKALMTYKAEAETERYVDYKLEVVRSQLEKRDAAIERLNMEPSIIPWPVMDQVSSVAQTKTNACDSLQSRS